MLPIGLTYADIQSMSREATALYPVWCSCFCSFRCLTTLHAQPLDPLPTLTECSSDEKRICELQIGFTTRLHKSQYFLVEKNRSTGACALR